MIFPWNRIAYVIWKKLEEIDTKLRGLPTELDGYTLRDFRVCHCCGGVYDKRVMESEDIVQRHVDSWGNCVRKWIETKWTCPRCCAEKKEAPHEQKI